MIGIGKDKNASAWRARIADGRRVEVAGAVRVVGMGKVRRAQGAQ